jgi:hypothetical protein
MGLDANRGGVGYGATMFRRVAVESDQCIRPGCAGSVEWHNLTSADLARFGIVPRADHDQQIREGTCPACGDRYRLATRT